MRRLPKLSEPGNTTTLHPADEDLPFAPPAIASILEIERAKRQLCRLDCVVHQSVPQLLLTLHCYLLDNVKLHRSNESFKQMVMLKLKNNW